jgi:hypothetical protein
MNLLLQQFEEAINDVLNDPRFDNIEAAELVGVLHIKAACICSRLQRMNAKLDAEEQGGPDESLKHIRREDDPADFWKDEHP